MTLVFIVSDWTSAKCSCFSTYQQHILRCIPPCVMDHSSFVVRIRCRREKLKLSHVERTLLKYQQAKQRKNNHTITLRIRKTKEKKTVNEENQFNLDDLFSWFLVFASSMYENINRRTLSYLFCYHHRRLNHLNPSSNRLSLILLHSPPLFSC